MFDEDEAYKDLEKKEIHTVEDNEIVKRLISSSTNMFKTITIGEQEIRVRAFMPRKIRIKLLKTGTALKNAKTDEQMLKIGGQLYQILAEMCLDSPFNKAKTWEVIDDKIGCAQSALVEILGKVTVTDKQIQSFR